MSLLLSIILLAPTPFTASPNLGWNRVGKWGSVATRSAREGMAGIVESPSGRIHIHRMNGPKTVTLFKLYPKDDALTYVITANGEALQIDLFISRKVRLSHFKGVIAAMRKQVGL